MSEQANVDIVQNIYAAFGRGDVAGILSLLDPQADLIFEGAPAIAWSGNRHGRDGWATFFQTVAEHQSDTAVVGMEPFAVQGDHVVCAGRYQGVVKKTGKRIDSPLVHLWTLRNGLVIRCQELTNTAAELAACTA
jgi:uncharacterized protein